MRKSAVFSLRSVASAAELDWVLGVAWYDEVFEGTYDLMTFHLFTPERNWEESEFIRTALQLVRGDEVLDLACGHGRHALLLARRGIRVTGLDKFERYLQMGREKAGDLPVRFVRGDLRTMEFHGEFDAAYCFFTSFGFYDDETNFDILRRTGRALAAGGRLLLDLQNRELYCSGEAGHEDFSEFVRDGIKCVLLSRGLYRPDTGHLQMNVKLYGLPDGMKTMEFSVRLYSLPELTWLLKQAGMRVTKVFGGSDGSAYRIDSQRLVVVADKT